MRSRQKPEYQVRIAGERIRILFHEAEKMVKKDQKLARRYVQLARKIGMRYNVRIPRELRRKFCRSCHSYLQEGLTSKTRVKNGTVNIKCFTCNKTIHYPYK